MSLSRRLVLAASAVLVACLGATGVALDAAFRDSALDLVRERLQAQVYAVLAAAETDERGRLVLVDTPPDPRLATPASGLFAALLDASDTPLWRSPSALGQQVSFPPPQPPGGAGVFAVRPDASGNPYFTLVFSIDWESLDGVVNRYHVHIAERSAGYEARLGAFRRNLWGWFAVAGAALVLAQGAVLAWGLAPLRRVAAEVRAIQDGRRQRLEGVYPAELQPLTRSLNGLLEVSERRLARYRHALADLAHSLKTPLAVMRGALQGDQAGLRASVEEQVQRMDRAVAYQLQRAGAGGHRVLGPAIEVAPLVRSLAASLAKVYADRRLHIDVGAVAAEARFRGDEGDLMELLGNLMDNACKWASARVAVRARSTDEALVLEVEDDGPGIEADQVDALLARGGRADPDVPGQGIGLAVVVELVGEAYGGRLAIERGQLGGALLRVQLPTVQ